MKLAIRIFVEQGDEFDRVPVRISEVELSRWHPSDHQWLRLSGVGADPAAAGTGVALHKMRRPGFNARSTRRG